MKKDYSRGSDLLSGETVTAGTFLCCRCDYQQTIEKVTNLPVCPRCQNETWRLK